MPAQVKVLSPQSELSFVSGWYEIAEDSHFWMQGRLRAFLKQLHLHHIPVDQPLRGLEIGCGRGILRSQIERHTQWVIDGTDLDLAALKNNPSCRGELYLYNIFDRQDALKGRYDFIILYDVIEHIEDVGAFLEAALFHLKPGGYVFVNVPALKSLYSNYDKVVGHLRRYDSKILNKQMEDVGLKIVHTNYWGMIFLPILWCRKIFLSREKREGAIVQKGFDPKSSLLNTLLKAGIQLEVVLIPNPVLGTSVMTIAQKRA